MWRSQEHIWWSLCSVFDVAIFRIRQLILRKMFCTPCLVKMENVFCEHYVRFFHVWRQVVTDASKQCWVGAPMCPCRGTNRTSIMSLKRLECREPSVLSSGLPITLNGNSSLSKIGEPIQYGQSFCHLRKLLQKGRLWMQCGWHGCGNSSKCVRYWDGPLTVC